MKVVYNHNEILVHQDRGHIDKLSVGITTNREAILDDKVDNYYKAVHVLYDEGVIDSTLPDRFITMGRRHYPVYKLIS